jgi:hypothetical protein
MNNKNLFKTNLKKRDILNIYHSSSEDKIEKICSLVLCDLKIQTRYEAQNDLVMKSVIYVSKSFKNKVFKSRKKASVLEETDVHFRNWLDSNFYVREKSQFPLQIT